jgi:tetratricopeptide (TPR) repeat protein
MKDKKLSLLMTLAFVAVATIISAQTLEEGITKIEKEDYAGARQIFEKLIAAKPEAAEPYYYMGESYYEEERYDLARQSYDKGLVMNKDAALCLIGQGKLALDAKKTDEAAKLFEKAGKWTRNKKANIFYEIAKAYTFSLNPNADLALETIDKAIVLNNKDARNYTLKGDASLVKKDAGGAVRSYEYAIEKSPKDPINYLRRAKVWRQAQEFAEAEKMLNTCLEIDPNYAPAMKDIIEVYNGKKAYDKITPMLARYTALVGDDIEARARYVRFLCFQAKNYPLAIEESKKVLAKDANRVDMYRWQTWAYCENKQYQEALDASKQFVAKKGDRKMYAYDYEYAAKAAAELKDIDGAVANYKLIPTVDSTRNDVYAVIGKMLYDNKKYADCVEAYKVKMEKTKPDQLDYYYSGMSNMKMDKYAEADANFLKVTEINPKWITGYDYRAFCNEKIDKPIGDPACTGMAKPYYEKVAEMGVADEAKNASYLKRAYYYLGSFAYYVKNDNATALPYFEKYAVLDPANTNVQQLLAEIKGAPVVPGNK